MCMWDAWARKSAIAPARAASDVALIHHVIKRICTLSCSLCAGSGTRARGWRSVSAGPAPVAAPERPLCSAGQQERVNALARYEQSHGARHVRRLHEEVSSGSAA